MRGPKPEAERRFFGDPGSLLVQPNSLRRSHAHQDDRLAPRRGRARAARDNSGPGHGGHGVRLDTYNLKGTLSGYTAAVGTTPGSITIQVMKGNRAGRPFVGMTLTFVLTTATKIEPRGAVILDGDRGSVQLKAAEGLDATGLQMAIPKKVEDEFDDD